MCIAKLSTELSALAAGPAGEPDLMPTRLQGRTGAPGFSPSCKTQGQWELTLARGSQRTQSEQLQPCAPSSPLPLGILILRPLCIVISCVACSGGPSAGSFPLPSLFFLKILLLVTYWTSQKDPLCLLHFLLCFLSLSLCSMFWKILSISFFLELQSISFSLSPNI